MPKPNINSALLFKPNRNEHSLIIQHAILLKSVTTQRCAKLQNNIVLRDSSSGTAHSGKEASTFKPLYEWHYTELRVCVCV